MKKLWKTMTALGCAAVVSAQILPLTAFAIEPAQVHVLALGDEGLASATDTSAAAYVADYLGATLSDYTQTGKKASDLLTEVESDAALQADLVQADVILLSVGVNDLADPILYENADLLDASQYTSLDDMVNALSTSSALLLNDRLAASMPAIVESANQSIEALVQAIYQKNTSADIIIQTVSNPLAVEFTKINASDNRRWAFHQLYEYMEVYLNGGKTTNNAVIAEGVNQKIKSLPHVSVSDFHDAFVGADGEEALGFYLTNISSLDMRFTEIGKLVAAASALDAAGLTVGNGSVLADAYAATGENATLPALRASLDSAIQTAAGNAQTVYALGDVNADAAVTLDDAFLTLQQYAYSAAGGKHILQPAQRRAADADNDGKLSMDDAFLWLQYYSMCAAGQDVDLEAFLVKNGRN